VTAQEAEIEKIMVGGQLGQKVNETPSQPKKLGLIVPACHSSYMGSINRRIVLQASLRIM
jgi:hypothetical protein